MQNTEKILAATGTRKETHTHFPKGFGVDSQRLRMALVNVQTLHFPLFEGLVGVFACSEVSKAKLIMSVGAKALWVDL
jgi:hypothetical protein